MGEEKRNQMMQNLFGDQSEDEEEVDSAQDSTHQPDYLSGEGESGIEVEGESKTNVQRQEELEIESEADLHDADPDPYKGESEGDKAQSSVGREVSINQRLESEGKEVESDDEDYGQRVVTSRRRDVVDSESERSNIKQYDDDDDDDDDDVVDQDRDLSKSRSKENNTARLSQSVAEMRDVFGDSDEEDEPADYANQKDLKKGSQESPIDEEDSYEKNLGQEDMLHDDDAQFGSEEDIYEQKLKEKPVGPPLELEIPLRLPPGLPDKMNTIRISNIMGIEPNPFDPKTYTEEDMFETDESGAKKRIRLENNVVRWRSILNPDGTKSYESNARFVKWSDGSMQLLIGNEVLDISVQEAHHDQAHLFVRHEKGVLQSQGKLQRKMRFMPSSLSSNSHKLLTALVDSRHKKVYKVKNCITEVDPEKEREEKIKAASQTIRANTLLDRKREKVNKKYPLRVDKRRQLSPGFLEDALSEDDGYNGSRRAAPRSRYEEDWEAEARAEKRIMSAKRPMFDKDRKKTSASTSKLSRRPAEDSDYESEREESVEYESGPEDELDMMEKTLEERKRVEEDEDEEVPNYVSEDEFEEPRANGTNSRSLKQKDIESDEESPPRKQLTNRRKTLVYSSDED